MAACGSYGSVCQGRKRTVRWHSEARSRKPPRWQSCHNSDFSSFFFFLRGDRADPLLGVMGLGNLQCKRWDDDGAKKRCSAAVWLFCHLASEESPTFALNRGVKKKKRWGRQAEVRRYWVLTRRRQLVIQMMPCESVHILWTFQHLTTWKPKTFCALLGTKMVALYFLPFLLYKKEDNWIDSNTNTSICIQIKWVSI